MILTVAATIYFFAEVAQIKGESVEYVLNCFCMVQHNDNGILFRL